MKVADLRTCPLLQKVYIIEPGKEIEDIFMGYIANIPLKLMNKEIHCMYAAYNKKTKEPVLIVNL